jgi:CRP/FNR family transcriptional regulator
VTDELRSSFRKQILVGRRDAIGRVTMFLRMLEQQTSHEGDASKIDIPMSRSDMANYLGLSLEAVSRACRALEQKGIVDFIGRHSARIVNRPRFDKLTAAL